MQNIGVIGASGFIGKHLVEKLIQSGYHVIGFSRTHHSQKNLASLTWRNTDELDFSHLHALVNLAGESVDRLWTQSNKKKFYQSRVTLTEQIKLQLPTFPNLHTWINASAVGFYGDGADIPLNESSPKGTGYLADLCQEWENAVAIHENSTTRKIIVRVGIVLGKGGSAWGKIHRLFSLGLGGKLGSGKQYMPWIHIDDMTSALMHCLENPTMNGIVNATAPCPITNQDFTHALAKALNRPAFFHAPAFLIRVALGEMGSFILGGARVTPSSLSHHGFTFKNETIDHALRSIIAP